MSACHARYHHLGRSVALQAAGDALITTKIVADVVVWRTTMGCQSIRGASSGNGAPPSGSGKSGNQPARPRNDCGQLAAACLRKACASQRLCDRPLDLAWCSTGLRVLSSTYGLIWGVNFCSTKLEYTCKCTWLGGALGEGGIAAAWWAHQDLNLEPTDYEFASNAASPAKSRVAHRNLYNLKVVTQQ